MNSAVTSVARRVGEALTWLGLGLYGLSFALPVYSGSIGVGAFVVGLGMPLLWSPNALLWASLILRRRHADAWAALTGLVALAVSLGAPSAVGFEFYVQAPGVGYWAWVASFALVTIGASIRWYLGAENEKTDHPADDSVSTAPASSSRTAGGS